MIRTFLAAAVLALAGCATGATTPYAAPRITIDNMTAEQAKMRIVPACIEGGGTIEESTPNQVICARPFDDSFGSMMYQALMTPRYSTRPSTYVRYSLVETQAQLYIAVDTYIENQTAYGRVDRTPVRNSAVAAQAQAFLDRIRDEHAAGAGVADSVHAESAPVSSDPQDPDPAKRVPPPPAMKYRPSLR